MTAPAVVRAAFAAPLAARRDPDPPGEVTHHFTVDVEDYFQVSALEQVVSRDSWSQLESRVVASTHTLLELLAERGVRGTFFVLGWIADRHPGLVRDIAAGGHEVASHGWDHRRVTTLTAEEFRGSVRRTKDLLESLAGKAVLGFRAPSFSIVRGGEWALDVLLEEGYAYDSSLFPVRRPGYGFARGRRDPHWIERDGGRIAEAPPATILRLGMTLPAAGGAYFRLLPYALVQEGLRDSARRGASGTFYIHPWEVDPDQPRIPAPLSTRIRHYGGLRRTTGRIRRLLAEFRFRPISDTIARL